MAAKGNIEFQIYRENDCFDQYGVRVPENEDCSYEFKGNIFCAWYSVIKLSIAQALIKGNEMKQSQENGVFTFESCDQDPVSFENLEIKIDDYILTVIDSENRYYKVVRIVSRPAFNIGGSSCILYKVYTERIEQRDCPASLIKNYGTD